MLGSSSRSFSQCPRRQGGFHPSLNLAEVDGRDAQPKGELSKAHSRLEPFRSEIGAEGVFACHPDNVSREAYGVSRRYDQSIDVLSSPWSAGLVRGPVWLRMQHECRFRIKNYIYDNWLLD